MPQEEIEPLLNLVESAISEDNSSEELDQEPLLHATTIRALMAIRVGKFQDAVEDSIKAMKQIPDDNVFIQAVLALNLGVAFYAVGELASAGKHLRDGYRLCMESENYAGAIGAKSYLGYTQLAQGLFHESEQAFNKVIEIGTKVGGGQPIPISGYGHIGLGQIFYEWNNLSEAEIHLKQGIELGEKVNDFTTGIRGNLALARLKQAQKDFGAAEAALSQAMASTFPDWRMPEGRQIEAWTMELRLAQENTMDTSAWADSRSEQLDDKSEHMDIRLDTVLAKIRLQQERPNEALSILEKLLRDAKDAGRAGDTIEILALMAIAEIQNESTESAMSSFQAALDLGEPQGYVRTFIDHGKAIEGLLKEAISRQIKVDYASKLLMSLNADSKISKSHRSEVAGSQPLIDPLTERELEVLALVAERLKYQEIADRLVVSLNTIRTHSKNIYSKLGVKSATQAADRAKELGLIK